VILSLPHCHCVGGGTACARSFKDGRMRHGEGVLVVDGVLQVGMRSS
jgi:hypothetical protein